MKLDKEYTGKGFKMTKIIALLLCACGLITSCGPAYSEGATEAEKAVELMNWRIAEICNTVSEYEKDAEHIYYVSTSGDDSNDGLSPEAPLKTPKAANKLAKEGDVVLFKRGDEWRVRWQTIPGVTYSAYGEGPKPVFNGNTYGDAADPSLWKLVEGSDNIWEYKKQLTDVGNIVFNGGESTGEKICPAIDNKKLYVWGKNGYEEFAFNNNIFYENLGFISKYVHLGNNGTDAGIPARLFLRCDEGNPGEIYDSIELCYRGTLIKGNSNVTLDNICIKYTGGHGIGMGTIENVTVRNCEVGWIGGTMQYYKDHYMVRFGNGIEVYGGCKNYTVDNCYVYQCYDAGITHQYGGGEDVAHQENVQFTDNVIEKCIYNIEYFLAQTESGKTEGRIIKNSIYKGNILAYSGEGWGYDPSRAAGIKGWDSDNRSENFVIEDNIFLLNKIDAWDLGFQGEDWSPIFRNNTYIHHTGKRFVRFGKRVDGEYVSTSYTFDKNAEKSLEEIGETGATVVRVKP